MQLVSSAAFLWAVRVGTMVSSALLSVITARFLGPHGRGLYVLPAINANLATTFAVGLSVAVTYYLLNVKAGRNVARGALIGLLLFAFGGAVITAIAASLSHSLWAIVPATLFMLFYAVNAMVGGYFIGRDRVRTAAATNGAAYLLTLLLVLLALIRYRSSPIAAIYGLVIAWGLVGLVGATLALRDAKSLQYGVPIRSVDLLRFAGKAGTLSLANLLNYRVDLYVVAMLLPVAALGQYTIAVTGAESALSLSLAIAQSTLPRVGTAGRADAGDFVAKCLRNGLFLAVILSAGAFCAAPPIITVLFGSSYLPIIWPFRLLLVGVIAASTTAIISNYFMVNLGRAHVPLTTSLFSAVLCAAISFELVPHLGMVGAAIGSTVAYILSQTVALMLFCKESGVKPLKALLVNGDDFSTYRRILRRMAFRHT